MRTSVIRPWLGESGLLRSWAVLPLLVAGAHCGNAPPSHSPVPARPGQVFQVSTIQALMAGHYDPAMTFGDLRRYGDFGLGTFAGLDGEMIAVNGEFYQVRADGRVYGVPDEAETPFAAVTFFAPDTVFRLVGPMDLAALTAHLDQAYGTSGPPLAIRVEGRFTTIQTRSVPRQEKPYLPFAEVTATQRTFDLQEVEGVMVGFRFPTSMRALNAEGYHFHFITADRQAGGHVLSFRLASATVSLAQLPEFLMRLPWKSAFYGVEPASPPPSPR